MGSNRDPRQEVTGELGAATSCPPSSGGAGRRRTPVMEQRAVLRPYLHHVLDEWFERDGQPRRKGRCFLIRFADDFVMGCELEADARKIMAVLPKRFARFGLRIHPTKTALIAFRKPEAPQGAATGNGTFDFLGLTHYWTQSRRGFWVIKRRTARKRLCRTKQSLWRWCRTHRHAPFKDQYQRLCQK